MKYDRTTFRKRYSEFCKKGLYDSRLEHDSCGVGFVVDIKGRASNSILSQALTLLNNLDHRGARGADPDSGDGAGILFQIPHKFFKKVFHNGALPFPLPGNYGVGMFFLPRNATLRESCKGLVEDVVSTEGMELLFWRDLPVDDSSIGIGARSSQPFMCQAFIRRPLSVSPGIDFERKLFVIRKLCENKVVGEGLAGDESFYVSSLSSRTIVYKGMLTPGQMNSYYTDLADSSMETAIALVHSRFSTNTFPSWERAHPYRYVIHNGEINTLRGNVNWMHARESLFESELLGEDMSAILPVLDQNGSDSAIFDNCLEFLVMAGRSLPHAVMMMIPEPWEKHTYMNSERKAFYEYHGCLMEPWDGPASIAFTDGEIVGVVLDRNGLRPSRYYITKDDIVVMASEVGVLDIPSDRILHKGRLRPGRMFLVDTKEGLIINDGEIKHNLSQQHPYVDWLHDNMMRLKDLPRVNNIKHLDGSELLLYQRAFGYTSEQLRMLISPMAVDGVEPVASMGADTPLAVLSRQPQLLYSYFKQLFAQVTNPPIDSIREDIITSAATTIGSERNLLNPEPESCRQLKMELPVITNEEIERIRHIERDGFRSVTLPVFFDSKTGGDGLCGALNHLFKQAEVAINKGITFLILSDRGVNSENTPIPALLAVSGLHHYLIRKGSRTRVAIILESAEPREIHHFALLLGYGAGAINPYLALDTVCHMSKSGILPGLTEEEAERNYINAAVKGVVKTISKMGISTIHSYRGAQIFEAVGINSAVVDKFFTWTHSRIEGIGIDAIAKEAEIRHKTTFAERSGSVRILDEGGLYKWRSGGERHLFNPESVFKLQQACRNADFEAFQEYSGLVNNQSEDIYTLRGLMRLKFAAEPVPVSEVESVESLCRRFKTGAMSYGSISPEAHQSIAIAMNRLGGKSNSGEGGEDPGRYIVEQNGDSKCSAIKQVASGRFGVTSQYLVNAKEIQIKMAQGAKPGEGGQLPGRKVYPWIARVRHSTPGVGLISPPPHHDIYSIEDLAELIYDLKNANSHARINVKLVSEVGVGTIAAGVAKAHADVVLISGFDGGTGASPRSSIHNAGLPWELGLADTHQTLMANGLRNRIVVETDGQLKTGRDLVIAALLGAEEFGFATTVLVSLGCVMMRVCHLDTCPVGVATQNPLLRNNFTGRPEHVENFMRFIAEDVRILMSKLGFHTLNEMVGRADRLEMRDAVDHWKAEGLDFSRIFYVPDVEPGTGSFCQVPQDHGLEKSLDNRVLLKLCEPALDLREPVRAHIDISNTDRAVGAILGSEVTRHCDAEGLPEDTIKLHFTGSAGQSFGAFIPKGITFVLEGDANDYMGKGLSGGRIIVFPPKNSVFLPEENIILGNVAFYGATSGEAYIYGMAGERFCVRNSGLNAVVESIGDHGCEYMTGGKVVVLGTTGRNFAAGMTGGVAYVMDESDNFPSRCNQQTVYIERLNEEDLSLVLQMIKKYVDYTESSHAVNILSEWERTSLKFVKIIPKDYKRVLESLKKVQESGITGEEAVMRAFEQNINDSARVGGN